MCGVVVWVKPYLLLGILMRKTIIEVLLVASATIEVSTEIAASATSIDYEYVHIVGLLSFGVYTCRYLK